MELEKDVINDRKARHTRAHRKHEEYLRKVRHYAKLINAHPPPGKCNEVERHPR